MRLVAFLLALLSTCVLLPPAAANDLGRPSTLAVNAATAEAALMPWATVIRDPAKNKTLEEVMASRDSVQPHPDREVFSAGFSSAAYWFVLTLDNDRPSSLERLLVFDPPWLDDVRVTLIDPAGARQSLAGGDIRAFRDRSEPHRLINFSLELPPGKSLLVVRIETRDPFFVDMRLMERRAFEKFAATESLYFGLVYGGLLSLLLFNFVLFTSSREKTYLAYSVLLASFLLMHGTYNGHVFRWLLADFPEVSNWSHSVFIYFYCLCGLVFAVIFLELEAKLPLAYAWMRRLLMVLAVSFVASAALGGYRGQVASSIVWVVLFAVTASTLGLLSLRRRNAAAAYYLSASMAGLLGSSITAFTVMGILPYTFMTFRAADFGMLIDAIMLSLALSARVAQGRRLERLRRFFSPAVANQLLSATSEELYRPHQREIVVMFLDLRGYTAFTLKHGADEVMRVLGEFHAAMGELIASHEATLERFAGDGMMIFLNDPVEIPDPAKKACEMALRMQERFAELNGVWEQRGYSLSMGVGIAQGVATIGAIGFEGRRDYAAIGTVTNLAARLCAEAGPGQILVSSAVAENLAGDLRLQPVEDLALKGFSEPVRCYEIAALAQQLHTQPLRVTRAVAA